MVLSDQSRDDSQMTAEEVRFVEGLRSRIAAVDVWLHTMEGRPWLIASLDEVQDGRIVRTWRVDFDQAVVSGGLSPAFLNWDDGVSADDAGIDTQPPTGLPAIRGTPEHLAVLVADWLEMVTARL